MWRWPLQGSSEDESTVTRLRIGGHVWMLQLSHSTFMNFACVYVWKMSVWFSVPPYCLERCSENWQVQADTLKANPSTRYQASLFCFMNSAIFRLADLYFEQVLHIVRVVVTSRNNHRSEKRKDLGCRKDTSKPSIHAHWGFRVCGLVELCASLSILCNLTVLSFHTSPS